MNISIHRLLGGLAVVAVLVLGGGSSVLAADPTATPGSTAPSGPSGDEMLSVQPSLIGISADPGAAITVPLTLRAAADLQIVVQSRGLAQATDGSFKAVGEADDATPFSARQMLSAEPGSFEMHPGETKVVNVHVAVPTDVGEGTRYAILTITGNPIAAPGSSDNVGFGVELGVSTIVQIADTQQTRLGEISALSIGEALPGQPLPVRVTFDNTGNSHYGAIPNELLTTAVLQDPTGTQIATATANGNQLSVIPGFTRAIDLRMTPDHALVDNTTYHLEVGVGL